LYSFRIRVPSDVTISTIASLGTEFFNLKTEQLKTRKAVIPKNIFLKALNI
jgi:hypothetical protein